MKHYAINKKTAALMTAVLSLAMLNACTAGETDGSRSLGHTHTLTWSCDARDHWQVCWECGEKQESAPHTLTDDYLCEICHSEIWDYGEGVCDITTYNEYGDVIRNVYYCSDGTIEYDYRYDIEYDENGNRTGEKVYTGDFLCNESLYALDADGYPYVVKAFDYFEDGSVSTYEYDEMGDLQNWECRDVDGNIINKSEHEYAYNADGDRYQIREKDYDYLNNKIYIAEYNEYGDQSGRTICSMDGTVEQVDRYERGYNEDGDAIWKKEYKNDVLVSEVLNYKTVSGEDYFMRFPETVIEYHEDGSRTVTENGDYGDPAKVTDFNADGTTARVVTYTYRVDEEDTLHVASMTEYNGNGDLVSEVFYDAEGNAIE